MAEFILSRNGRSAEQRSSTAVEQPVQGLLRLIQAPLSSHTTSHSFASRVVADRGSGPNLRFQPGQYHRVQLWGACMDQDQLHPDGQPDEDDESAAEHKLFDGLQDAILRSEEFADAIVEYQIMDGLTAHLQNSRDAIWRQVAVQRLRVRETMQRQETILNDILPAAEESIRQSRPDLVKGEADLDRALADLNAGAQAVNRNLDTIRALREQEESQRERARYAAMVHDAEQAIDRLDMLLETGSEAPEVATEPGRSKIRSPRWISRRRESAEPGPEPGPDSTAKPATDAELGRQYQKHVEDLSRLRHNIADIATARRRIEQQISTSAERIVGSDETLREVQLQVEAAQTELEAALGEALFSEVRQYMNQHAFQAFDVHLQVVEASGLYQSLPDSDVIQTLAIDELERTLLRMSGASIGIAGPRGAGKSTAINYLYAKFRLTGQANPDLERGRIRSSRYRSRSPYSGEESYYPPGEERYETGNDDGHPYPQRDARAQPPSSGRPHFFGTVVSAPVKYSPRDFVLHLFAELCRDIAGPDADRRITPVEQPKPEKVEWVTLAASATALVAGAVAALVTVCLDPSLIRPAAVVTLCNSVITAACVEFFLAPRRPYPRPEFLRSWQRYLARRIIAISSLAFVMAGIAIVGVLAVAGSLGRTLWLIGFCGFVMVSLIPGVPAGRGQDTPRPVNPRTARSRLRRLGVALRRSVTMAAQTAADRIGAPGFSAMTAGSVALLSLRFPPRNAVVSFSGCVTLLIAAAALIPLSDVRSQYQRRAAAGAHKTSTEQNGERAVVISFRFSYILKIAAAIMVFAGYALIHSGALLPAAAILLPGSALVVLGVIALNMKWMMKEPEVATDIPHWPSEQLLPPTEMPTPVRYEDSLEEIALQYLRDIRFQQSFSIDRNQSWTVASPGSYLSLANQRTLGTAWAREPRTLPEIVARLRDFIMVVHGRGHRLIVGIDELDKLSEADAQSFLNDIKAIFGIRGCNFLVSVSEDAAADFERRGVPFRSTFDSSFDDIVSIGYFDRITAAMVLEARITGLFRPFILLCHALSGGLARDLVRIARELLADADRELLADADKSETQSETLSQAAHRLCHAELEAKTLGICRQLARMDVNPWAAELIADILGDGAPPKTAADHLERCAQLHSWVVKVSRSQDSARDTKALDACQRAGELASFACFTGTVLEFFAEYLTEPRMIDLTSGFSNPRSIERLAASRQAMAASPRQAMRYLTDFREAWRLPSLPATSA